MKVYSLSDFLTKSQNYFYLMAYNEKKPQLEMRFM